VTVRVRTFVRSLHHQHRDLHQLTYLYLSKDQESTSHQVVSDFRLPMQYYRVPLFYFIVFHTEIHRKAKKITLSTVLKPFEPSQI
jgi:hypothetical protein